MDDHSEDSHMDGYVDDRMSSGATATILFAQRTRSNPHKILESDDEVDDEANNKTYAHPLTPLPTSSPLPDDEDLPLKQSSTSIANRNEPDEPTKKKVKRKRGEIVEDDHSSDSEHRERFPKKKLFHSTSNKKDKFKIRGDNHNTATLFAMSTTTHRQALSSQTQSPPASQPEKEQNGAQRAGTVSTGTAESSNTPIPPIVEELKPELSTWSPASQVGLYFPRRRKA